MIFYDEARLARGNAVLQGECVGRDPLTDAGVVKLLAARYKGRKEGNADRTAQVAEHIEEGGAFARILARDGRQCQPRDGNDGEGLPEGADDVREDELVFPVIKAHVRVHKATARKQKRPEEHQHPHVKLFQ